MEIFLCKNNYQELKNIASKIIYLEEGQIDYIISKDYYQAKLKDDFKYERIERDQEDVQMIEENKKTECEEQDKNSAE